MTVLVALWELGSGQHLPSEFVNQHALGDGVLLATFGNPNNFGAFLVLSIPFIGIVATRPAVRWELGRTDRVLARILLVLLPILLLLSGSRFALIGLVVASGAYVALNRRDRSAWRFGGLLLLAGTGLSTFAIESGQRIVAKLGRFTDPSAFVQDSTEIRANLVLNGLVYLGRSGGVGIGPAGFEESIASGDVAFAVRPGVVNAHNFWVELLSQYGLIGGLLLGVVIVSATATYVRMTRDRPYGADRHRATLMLTGLAGYVFASMTASSYINAPENWMFIASFLALAPALVTIGREGRSLDDRVDTDEESGVVAASSGT
ncbi:MAG: O-antigen ligase family protein [Ilumatobacter sp.]|nr:O-antigen ligase family protein [Ilumatobacter sp.]